MCEDYRASASVDLVLDRGDNAAGRKIICRLLALWAGKGLYPRLFDDVLGIWREEGADVQGRVLPDATHNLQESAPGDTLHELQVLRAWAGLRVGCGTKADMTDLARIGNPVSRSAAGGMLQITGP